MAVAAPAIITGWAMAGNAATVVGLTTTPIFLISAIWGLWNNAEALDDTQVIFRFHAGKAGVGYPRGGNLPSVAGWDVNGVTMCGDKKHDGPLLFSDHIAQGASMELHCETKENDRPVYIAVVAQKDDAICIAGVEIAYTGSEPNLLLGDIGAVCGMPWYHSRIGIGSSEYAPACMWIDGSNKTDTSRSQGSKEQTDVFDGAPVSNPPAGFMFHLPSFMGAVAKSEAVARQRSANGSDDSLTLTCGHPARFHVVWDDLEFEGHFKTKIFKDKPFPRNQTDYTDFGDPKDNFTAFANLDWEWSDSVKHHLSNIDRDDIEEEAAPSEEENAAPSEEKEDEDEDSTWEKFKHKFNPFDDRKRTTKSKQSLLDRIKDHLPNPFDRKRNPEPTQQSLIRVHEWRHHTLVKDEASARALCASPTSWGADWYSHSEGMFCDMATKTLLPACEHKRDKDCFDVGKGEIRHEQCGKGRVCGRAAHLPRKVYKRVEDSRSSSVEERDVGNGVLRRALEKWF